ncbi:MAG: hypothetical protein HC913_20555 [Microscillaceae bacterium]|nr:hypothetical protein [Microscillaceae bacterium]
MQTTYLQLAQHFIEAGQPDSAQLYLAQILDKPLAKGAEWEEIYFEALPLQSQLLPKGNAYEKQLTQALQAYPQSPHRHKLWFYLAQHHYQQQEFGAAQKAFLTFLQLAPATEISLVREAQLRLVQCHLAQNQIVSASQLLEEIRLTHQVAQKSSTEKLVLKIKRLGEVIYPALK